VSGSHQYGLAAATTDIPPSFGSSSLPRPIASSVQIVNLASQSGTQGSGGLISFQMPTGAAAGGYLKPNSLYLRGTCNLTGAGGAPAAYALPSSSASCLINRMTCSVGGTIVSQINNYHLLHEMLLQHTTSYGYFNYDSKILEGTAALSFAAAVNPTHNFVIPVINPLFTADKAVPLFLLNAPIQVNFDLNNLNNAIRAQNAGDATAFTITNAQLVYEVVHVDANYVNEVKSALGAGNAYQINLHDFQTLMTASAGSLNYNIGANLSSVRGIAYTQVTNAPALLGDTLLTANAQTDFRLYLDGRLINSFAMDTGAAIYAEMNRTFGNMFDSNITTNSGSAATYLTNYFTGGISCNRVSDVMAMTGSAAQNINFVLTSAGGNNNTYIVVLFDQILTIDVTGNVMLVK
jgi:hypothetical protein